MPLSGPAIQAFTTALSRAFKTTPTLVELDAEAIARSASEYEADDIPAGAIRAAPAIPAEELSTLFFNHLLVGRSGLDDDIAAALARQLFESRVALAAAVPAARFIQTAKTEKDAAVPIHPGAAAYLDGSEKTFFDRHGDMLLYGSMLLSMLGTGTVAIYRSFTQRRSAAAPNRVARLWTIAAEAGRAGSAQELETHEAALLTEFDAVVQAFARRQITDAEMMTAAVVFSQTVNLVADRRQSLGRAATDPPSLLLEKPVAKVERPAAGLRAELEAPG
jgi:hypothetical protein